MFLAYLLLVALSVAVVWYGLLPALDSLLRLIYHDDEEVINDEQRIIQDEIQQIDKGALVRLNGSRNRLGMHSL